MSLSPRASAVLYSLQQVADPHTRIVDVENRSTLYAKAKCSHTTFRRGVAEVFMLHLAKPLRPAKEGGPDRYEVTAEGMGTLVQAPVHPPVQGHHEPPLNRPEPAPEPPSSVPLPSSSSLENQEKEEEEESEGTSTTDPVQPRFRLVQPGSTFPAHGEVTITLPHDPREARDLLRALLGHYERLVGDRGHAPSVSSAGKPEKDRNGWTARDVSKACCGSTMHARYNSQHDEYFGFCVSCKAKFDPAKEGWKKGKRADQEQAKRHGRTA